MCTSPSASFSSTRSTNQGASIPRICRYSSRSCIPTFWHPHIVTHYKVGIPLKMNSQILPTERLVLRPYSLSDVEPLVRLAGAREVAATTLRIPHPYTEQDARNFIATYQASTGDEARFAITLRTDGQFCGGAGLLLDAAHHHAELGYWLGVPFW